MNLKLSVHFQTRMIERGINLDHIKKTVQTPDSEKVTFEDRIQARRKIDGKTLEVIYYKDAFRGKREEYIIITAYYL